MQEYEKLGQFYLGKPYDLDAQRVAPDKNYLLYDSKDLTTHAVCVGMTGSGKTGLCLSLLEEAAIDGIPAIAIDPKGDLGNLLLTFPNLAPADFKPWVDSPEATRQGLTADQYAEKTAKRWRDGLASWDEPPERIQRLRDAADVAIYTPGSNAGLPLTVLRSFAAPGPAVMQNADALRERIAASVSGLLALLGVDADPLRSREHILLSNILDRAWREGRSVDMAALIREIQSPPFDKVGFLDLESFFPAKDRFGLSMSLNNLLASPGFSAWMEGGPLAIQRLLYTPDGKPRIAVISISHLADAERMFFVTILLNEMIGWMRSQSGTSSLRALLYMDEVFGYFPPTANPPSKTPMLTLLKQARAFGLGVVLATQNPVDLDYKGLANCGTWFVGRLQTERDKARLLDGLEGASATSGTSFDRQEMAKVLSGLGNRVFLMNNVHEDQQVVFQTRWTLSYLRGPLTRDQIASLMQPRKAAAAAASPSASGTTTSAAASSTNVNLAASAAGARPVLPPGVVEQFVARAKPLPDGAKLLYRPGLVGLAQVHLSQSASGVNQTDSLALLIAAIADASEAAWDNAEADLAEAPELEKEPEAGATFATLPNELTRPKCYTELTAALKDHLYRTHRLKLWKCAAVKQFSQPGESEGDFRVRLSQAVREQRDLAVEKLRAKYNPKLATLAERLRKAEQRVEKEKAQASNSTMNAAIQFGTSVLGAIFGRKLKSTANVTRAATSMRSAGRVAKERADIGQAQETVEAVQEQVDALDAELQAEITNVQDSLSVESLALEELQVQPKKADITVNKVALVWTPWRVTTDGLAERAW